MSTNEWNDLIWKHQKKELPRCFPRLFIAARHHPEEGGKSSNSSRHDGWGRAARRRRRSYRAGFIPLKKNDLILRDMAKVGGVATGLGLICVRELHQLALTWTKPTTPLPKLRGLVSEGTRRRLLTARASFVSSSSSSIISRDLNANEVATTRRLLRTRTHDAPRRRRNLLNISCPVGRSFTRAKAQDLNLEA